MAVGEETAQTVLSVSCNAAVASSELLIALIKQVINSADKLKANTHTKDKHGNMSLQQLSSKNIALDSIPLQTADAMQIKRQLNKLGVDFSAVKNNNETVSLYFKGTDSEIILNSLKEYITDVDKNGREDKNDRENKEPIDDRIKTAKDKAEQQNAEKAKDKSREQHKEKSGKEKER